MKKITFLTLVMILGMSSMSFGKSYLCISEVGRIFDHNPEVRIVPEEKYVVRTLGDDKKMISVQKFGETNFTCLEGSSRVFSNTDTHTNVEKGESIKGNTLIICRSTYLKKYVVY